MTELRRGENEGQCGPQEVQGGEGEEGKEEEDEGEEEQEGGERRSEGCCPQPIRDWAKEITKQRSGCGLNVDKLDRARWPDIWRVPPHPVFATERGLNPDPQHHHHNTKMCFWAPDLFWPT